MLREIAVKDFTLQYELNYKKVKNINLYIGADGVVKVSANRFVPVSVIESFIISRWDLILKALKKYENVKQITLNGGDKIPVLGEEKTLSVTKGEKNFITLNGSALIMSVKNPDSFELKQKTFDSWLKNQSEIIITDLCKSIYPEFENATPFPTIKFRKMKSRGGSCQPKKNILTFNTLLLTKPFESVRYVVIHEFCHFIHPDHSKGFYDELKKRMPDYKIHRQNLRGV